MSVFNWRFIVLIAIGVLLVAFIGFFQAFSVSDEDISETEQVEKLNISLPFEGVMPDKYSRNGDNVSPNIRVSGVPEEAESLAVVMDDMDSPGRLSFTHWVIWNLPVNSSIPENLSDRRRLPDLSGAVQGENSFGQIGYVGPDPPVGTHTYRFRVYALNSELDLSSGASKKQLLSSIEGKMVGKAKLEADYSSS